MNRNSLLLVSAFAAVLIGIVVLALRNPDAKGDDENSIQSATAGLSPTPKVDSNIDQSLITISPPEEQAERMEPSGVTTDDPTIMISTPRDIEDIWAEQIRPGDIAIDDPRELQLARLASLRRDFIELLAKEQAGSDLHVKGRLLVHCSVAGILDSLSRFDAIDPSGSSFDIGSLDPATVSLQFNNRRYTITRGEFPVFDQYMSYEDSIRPNPSTQVRGQRELPALTQEDISATLRIADESLGWLLK